MVVTVVMEEKEVDCMDLSVVEQVSLEKVRKEVVKMAEKMAKKEAKVWIGFDKD